MKKISLFLLGLLASAQTLANPACAVCTVAIGASLTIARKFGVDDCIVGVWAGAMLAILGYWLIRWFDSRGWRFAGYKTILMAVSVASIGFMYFGELAYAPKVILGFLYLDSFLFASLAGAAVFIAAMEFYYWMKQRNNGRAHFPFEKVVLPVGAVALLSLAFHCLPICTCQTPPLMIL